MSELYIYDDDLVEDYNIIESLTKNVSIASRETKKSVVSENNKIITKENKTVKIENKVNSNKET